MDRESLDPGEGVGQVAPPNRAGAAPPVDSGRKDEGGGGGAPSPRAQNRRRKLDKRNGKIFFFVKIYLQCHNYQKKCLL